MLLHFCTVLQQCKSVNRRQLQLSLLSVCELQCTNGHLMCASCLSHLLADARLKDETATCPGCRCEISRTLCSRNLAVEKAISELPAPCQFCTRLLPRCLLARHEKEMCQDRFVGHSRTAVHFAAIASVDFVVISCAVRAVLTMMGRRTSPLPMSLQSVRCDHLCRSRWPSHADVITAPRLVVNVPEFWQTSSNPIACQHFFVVNICRMMDNNSLWIACCVCCCVCVCVSVCCTERRCKHRWEEGIKSYHACH